MNSLFRSSSISFILCVAGIDFFYNISKKYCYCSTNALNVLHIINGGGEDGFVLALAL
jgi:hypothetical protein